MDQIYIFQFKKCIQFGAGMTGNWVSLSTSFILTSKGIRPTGIFFLICSTFILNHFFIFTSYSLNLTLSEILSEHCCQYFPFVLLYKLPSYVFLPPFFSPFLLPFFSSLEFCVCKCIVYKNKSIEMCE